METGFMSRMWLWKGRVFENVLYCMSLMKVAEMTPKRLNFVNFLASVYTPEPCRMYVCMHVCKPMSYLNTCIP